MPYSAVLMNEVDVDRVLCQKKITQEELYESFLDGFTQLFFTLQFVSRRTHSSQKSRKFFRAREVSLGGTHHVCLYDVNIVTRWPIIQMFLLVQTSSVSKSI